MQRLRCLPCFFVCVGYGSLIQNTPKVHGAPLTRKLHHLGFSFVPVLTVTLPFSRGCPPAEGEVWF